MVAFVIVITFEIVVEDEVSFVCRVEVGFDWFVSFGVTVAFVAFVAFYFIFFVGGL